ncbi:unnamed protein product [Urochloa decumbens]|uniref:KIB1-4 beta-propeller domain-containing protein n=1 Tax=Urochloa decumbens TaxID=240449 RepID=A0ABC9A3P8_9POAL
MGMAKKKTPCSAAAQDRLLRTRSSSSSSTLHWGAKAKRSRPALGSRSRSSSRDWSDLDDGPAGLIAERVLTNGGAIDYIRFRAVCRPWRRCCGDPRTRALLEDSRLHPRGWIMLLGEEEELEAAAAPHSIRRQFLNVSTGQCIQVDVPELRDHGVIRSISDDGLLLLLRKGTGGSAVVRLLNPLTRQVAELPPITDLEYPPGHIGRCSPCTAAVVDGRWVLLYIHRAGEDGTLAFAKPGNIDERWVLVKIKSTGFLWPTMSFAGRFYGVAGDSIMVMDTTNGLPPRLVVAAKLAVQIRGMLETVHLVENGGEMMLVHRRMRPVRGVVDGKYYGCKRACKLYRVNLASGKTTPAAARGRAIFVGHCRALSVSPQVFPGISANAVYPALGLLERRERQQIVAYHLRDGTTESFSSNDNDTRSGLPHPWSIADCLATYVSG